MKVYHVKTQNSARL